MKWTRSNHSWHYGKSIDELHREDGPAEIWDDGDYFWVLRERSHRLCGIGVASHTLGAIYYCVWGVTIE